MEQARINVQEIAEVKQECKLCGCPKCNICKAYIKNEHTKTIVFITGSGISMIGFSVAFGTGFGFIGLGLSCGTILSLISTLI